MSYNVFYTPDFERQLKRLAKKYASLYKDLESLIEDLKLNPAIGIPLSSNCYKIRLAISSKGKGKSGGARVITCVVINDREVYLASIFDKSEKENITDKELQEIVKQVNP